MADEIKVIIIKMSNTNYTAIAEERTLTKRLRDAIGFCKQELEINAKIDLDLQYEERVNFERCLTENYLLKNGMDYFGKRDLIFVDLYGSSDVKNLSST